MRQRFFGFFLYGIAMIVLLAGCGPTAADDDVADGDLFDDDAVADDDSVDDYGAAGIGVISVTLDILAKFSDGQIVEPQIVLDPPAVYDLPCSYSSLYGLWDPSMPAIPGGGTTQERCRVHAAPESQTGIAPPGEITVDAGEHWVGVYLPSINGCRFVSTLHWVNVERNTYVAVNVSLARDITGTWQYNNMPTSTAETEIQMKFRDDLFSERPLTECASSIWATGINYGPCLFREDRLWVKPSFGASGSGEILEDGTRIEYTTSASQEEAEEPVFSYVYVYTRLSD
ncbi:MAG: hypothetical protein ABIG71_03570 [Candidatus Uhrbacteria bacterium]